MPRYYFNIDDGRRLLRDEDGTEFATEEAMRADASRLLPEIARDEIRGEGTRELSLAVRDEAGRDVFAARLAFTAEGPAPSDPSG
ncbi:DUF6894 family protein [Lutibaculum baratangense]|uniref:DUF6894 domain-containing protein n=1 Tax=Lutibaculum baratangense AMV1 TaxID=631454 RepID=V4QZU1_9HYPH|nr:hypothetical protein [Lutibaculum baratangense]ESR25282.1 hypothetical protein N177_1799 [Lutibaculum baratangense AMV1]